MKKFLITFINYAGITQQAHVEATNKERAILKFENTAKDASIKYCDEIIKYGNTTKNIR